MPPSASTQRVAKAARSSGRRARVSQRNFTFPVAIAAIVILGALLVGFGRDRRISASEIQPRVSQDHWHAAFGLYICDGFRPGLTDRFGDARGIHTHVDESTGAGDGVVHIHPFVSLASGRRADLSDFFHEIKLTATNSKIVLPGGETFENGTACPDGRAGSVKLLRWTDVFEGSPETITSDIAGTRFSGDLMGFVLAFVPDGVDVPAPASKLKLCKLTDYASSEKPPVIEACKKVAEDQAAAGNDTVNSGDPTATSTTVVGDTTSTSGLSPTTSTTGLPATTTTAK